MKLQINSILLAAGALALPGLTLAQPSAHYVPGVEGIKGASLPPPGFYVRDYNVGYYATRANDSAGHKVTPPNFEVGNYANVPRFIWITDTKFLGGFVGVDALLPVAYQSVRAGGYNGDTFGIGDFFAEATLSWHLKQFDLSAGAGVWMPTGDSAPGTTRIGSGYWTPMLTAGATWYVDADKTWAVSALNRYEFNTEQRDIHVTPGQAYTLEWGISKTLGKVWDVGVVGYYQQQVTGDSNEKGGDAGAHDRVVAIGPEISVAFPKQMFFVSLRYLNEIIAENRAQGHTFTLTLTKKL